MNRNIALLVAANASEWMEFVMADIHSLVLPATAHQSPYVAWT